jgi:hypothetical protein
MNKSVSARPSSRPTRQKEVMKRKLSYKKTRRRTNSQNHRQKEEKNYWPHRQPNKMNLRLDNPPFDRLYANIKMRANNSAPKPPSNPQQGLATHRLDVIDIFSTKSLPVDFIPSEELFPVNFVLVVAAKDDQINLHQDGINRRNGARLATGAAAGSSSFRKVGTGGDVLQVEPSPPPKSLELQGTTVPRTMTMKTSRSTMPPKLPLLESGQATNVAPYECSAFG